MKIFDARYDNFYTHTMWCQIWVSYTQKNNVLKDKYDFNIDKAVKLSFGLICDKTNETRCVPI